MQLTDLSTPTLILDRARLVTNLERMATRMRGLGVALRPHLKTAKSAEVAKLVMDHGAVGLTVSTVAEAAYFVESGFKDITYAVGFSADKLGRLVPLMEAGADITVIVDSQPAAYALIGAASPYDVTPKVLVEIDTGGRRGGLAPEDPAVIDIARLLHDAPDVAFAGVLTHAGHSYGCRSEAAIKAVAEEERHGVVQAAEALRQAGLPCPVVSVGSTPTAVFADDLTGVTEARPGVYMFGDIYQAMLGCCAVNDIAVSVMATVIGHRPDQDRVLIDAGALALSQDRGPDAFGAPLGLGQVCTLDGPVPLEGVRVLDAHQEHGFVGRPEDSTGPSVCGLLPIGTRVRVLPNHACMTAAQYTEYAVVDGGQAVVATWGRCSGW